VEGIDGGKDCEEACREKQTVNDCGERRCSSSRVPRNLSFDNFAANLLKHLGGFLRIHLDSVQFPGCSKLKLHDVFQTFDTALFGALRDSHKLFVIRKLSRHDAIDFFAVYQDRDNINVNGRS